ncbi:unnamed protein product [Arctia plantaginis]|uniref:Uncharacterized protein n=1 Tax=Arctia plantaginis TaxID=874455 RepID=A0A8S1AYQ8_ARCPL|nr:unnamed protein product [Arctia plantaginis]CAB3254962.1 unnamed protein product [Arctia plantaginis]
MCRVTTALSVFVPLHEYCVRRARQRQIEVEARGTQSREVSCGPSGRVVSPALGSFAFSVSPQSSVRRSDGEV